MRFACLFTICLFFFFTLHGQTKFDKETLAKIRSTPVGVVTGYEGKSPVVQVQVENLSKSLPDKKKIEAATIFFTGKGTTKLLGLTFTSREGKVTLWLPLKMVGKELFLDPASVFDPVECLMTECQSCEPAVHGSGTLSCDCVSTGDYCDAGPDVSYPVSELYPHLVGN